MTPDAKLRVDVYQEGQRAFSSGAICPYIDWRAKTWAKGHAAAKEWYSFNGQSESLEAMAQQEQGEPVAHFGSAYVNENGVHITTVLGPVAIPQDAKLYTTPQQRTWVGLTDAEIRYLQDVYDVADTDYAHAIETKLKEKNTWKPMTSG